MLEFYATLDSTITRETTKELLSPYVSYLLPASSWAGLQHRRTGLVGIIPTPKLPSGLRLAADCGGFVATRVWGDYLYSPQQYVTWLETFNPVWAATMDFCCEPEVVENKGLVADRQTKTTMMAHHFWQHHRQTPWAWVPTIQGWVPDDYGRHAQELAPLIAEMAAHYGANSEFRVGIGTLCRRDSAQMIHEVVSTVASVLPKARFHLWGVKLTAVQAGLPAQVASVDSAAWNGLFGRGINQWRTSGMRQAHYVLTHRLPAYAAKVAQADSGPKQMRLL